MPKKSDKQLSVRLHGVPVGILRQTLGGQLQFEYSDTAQQAISLSLPLAKKPFGNALCESFFAGLLPESEAARRVIALKYKINANNTFSLLRAIGYDCAGAISLQDLDEPIIDNEWHQLTTSVLSENELAQNIRELPDKPLFIGVKGLRLSLAGVQDKAAVVLKEGKVCLPNQGCPTTHILKPALKGFPGSVQNEYLCLRIAQAMKMGAVAAEIRCAKEVTYLLVERYDREVVRDKIRRIHQEDFCQALGIRSNNKYQKDGGPGFKQCFDLLLNTTKPAINRNKLVELLVFNLLIGNTDAHGKNFSLLHASPDVIQLAPAYDILSTYSYAGLSREMSMKIGNSYYGIKVMEKDWEKLCASIDYALPALKQTIKTQVEMLPEIAHQERANLKATKFDHEIADKIMQVIKTNCQSTKQVFGW